MDRTRLCLLLIVGVAGGVLSGLFGVGGGTVMVPLLVALAGFDQRRAAATSLVAILPAAVSGAVSYIVGGDVPLRPALVAAAIMAVGSVVGAVAGSALLRRLRVDTLRWLFAALLLAVAIQLALENPGRAGVVRIEGVPDVLGLVALGLVAGFIAGLFGVGGGVVVVPGLVIAFGSGDVAAKGVSLLVMIPSALSGSVGNLRRGAASLREGLTLGIPAAVAAPLGVWLAVLLPPRAATIAFALFLAVAAVRTVPWGSVRRARGAAGSEGRDAPSVQR